MTDHPTFPAIGRPVDELVAEIRAGRGDDADWRAGRTFSLVYNAADPELERLHEAVAHEYLHENYLNPFAFPGFSLHDELGLLVDAGLSRADALRAATINPAIFMGAEKTAGTIGPGKNADLVLLDANPLDDVANTKRIAAVVARGRFLDRAALDAILANAEKISTPAAAVKH